MESFEILQQQLLHMREDDISDVSALQKTLLEFRIAAEGIQNRLSHHLSFVHSVKSSVQNVDASVCTATCSLAGVCCLEGSRRNSSL